MGVPEFYRWLSGRYPMINETVDSECVGPFDTLYLDIKDIVHDCARGNSAHRLGNTEEEDLWVAVVQSLDRLVAVARPRKLLYLAADGVAPRAKMNLQRSRRFRFARDTLDAPRRMRETQEKLRPPTRTQNRNQQHLDTATASQRQTARCPPLFDTNSITTGTEFMHRLTQHLDYYVHLKLSDDPEWAHLTVILSGPDVPGEGAHKIMDYLRRIKSQNDYDPQTRHCLYGVDAELIMLGLISHEPHLSFLREEARFRTTTLTERLAERSVGQSDRFQLLHIGLLREYLAMEFCLLGQQTFRERYNGAQPAEDTAALRTKSRTPPEEPLGFVARLAETASKTVGAPFHVERAINDFVLICFMAGNDFLPHLPFADIHSGGLDSILAEYRAYLTERFASKDEAPWLSTDNGDICWPSLYRFMLRWARVEDEKLSKQLDDLRFLAGRQQASKSPGNCSSEMRRRHPESQAPANDWEDCSSIGSAVSSLSLLETRELGTALPAGETIAPSINGDVCNLSAFDSASPPEDTIEALCQYYQRKLHIDVKTSEGRHQREQLLQRYLEGLQWNLWYYHQGHRSWDWCYNFHYAPYVQSLLEYRPFKEHRVRVTFEPSAPSSPFLQLLCVLPKASAALLPVPYRSLVTAPDSPVSAFYPDVFAVDLDCASTSWGGVALIPFADTRRLTEAMRQAESKQPLTSEEHERNTVGSAHRYNRNCDAGGVGRLVPSTLPNLFKPIVNCTVEKASYSHPGLPAGYKHGLRSEILLGPHRALPGTPSFQVSTVTRVWLGKGITVLNSLQGRLPGLHINVAPPFLSTLGSPPVTPDDTGARATKPKGPSDSTSKRTVDSSVLQAFHRLMTSKIVVTDYPHRHYAMVVGLWSETYYFRTLQGCSKRRRKSPGTTNGTGGGLAGPYLFSTRDPVLPSVQQQLLQNEWKKLEQRGLHIDTEGEHLSGNTLGQCILHGLGYTGTHSATKYGRRCDLLPPLSGPSMKDVLVEVLEVKRRVETPLGTDYVFAFHTSYRPLLTVMCDEESGRFSLGASRLAPIEESHGQAHEGWRRCLGSVLKPGTEVICINERNPLFGCTGVVTHVPTISDVLSSSTSDVQCLIEVRQKRYDSRWATQNALFDTVTTDLKTFNWYTLEAASKHVGVPLSVLSWLIRSVPVTGPHRDKIDIGMNLVAFGTFHNTVPFTCSLSEGRSQSFPLCLPSFARIANVASAVGKKETVDLKRGEVMLSNFALTLVAEYVSTWPEVIEALRKAHRRAPNSEAGNTTTDGKRNKRNSVTLTPSMIFPDAPWMLQALSNWCRSQPFAKQTLGTSAARVLSGRGVHMVECQLDALMRERGNCKYYIRLQGMQELHPYRLTQGVPENVIAASAQKFFQTQQFKHLGTILLGQRVVYVKLNGPIPFGAFGCVTGTYLHPKTLEQMVELVTDEPHLGGSDLNGRCSPLRGLVAPASALMCLNPRVRQWGLSIGTHAEYQKLISASVGRLVREPRDHQLPDFFTQRRQAADCLLYTPRSPPPPVLHEKRVGGKTGRIKQPSVVSTHRAPSFPDPDHSAAATHGADDSVVSSRDSQVRTQRERDVTEGAKSQPPLSASSGGLQQHLSTGHSTHIEPEAMGFVQKQHPHTQQRGQEHQLPHSLRHPIQNQPQPPHAQTSRPQKVSSAPRQHKLPLEALFEAGRQHNLMQNLTEDVRTNIGSSPSQLLTQLHAGGQVTQSLAHGGGSCLSAVGGPGRQSPGSHGVQGTSLYTPARAAVQNTQHSVHTSITTSGKVASASRGNEPATSSATTPFQMLLGQSCGRARDHQEVAEALACAIPAFRGTVTGLRTSVSLKQSGSTTETTAGTSSSHQSAPFQNMPPVVQMLMNAHASQPGKPRTANFWPRPAGAGIVSSSYRKCQNHKDYAGSTLVAHAERVQQYDQMIEQQQQQHLSSLWLRGKTTDEGDVGKDGCQHQRAENADAILHDSLCYPVPSASAGHHREETGNGSFLLHSQSYDQRGGLQSPTAALPVRDDRSGVVYLPASARDHNHHQTAGGAVKVVHESSAGGVHSERQLPSSRTGNNSACVYPSQRLPYCAPQGSEGFSTVKPPARAVNGNPQDYAGVTSHQHPLPEHLYSARLMTQNQQHPIHRPQQRTYPGKRAHWKERHTAVSHSIALLTNGQKQDPHVYESPQPDSVETTIIASPSPSPSGPLDQPVPPVGVPVFGKARRC